MNSASLPVAIMGAGPIGLGAAANLIARGATPLVLEQLFDAGDAKPSVAEAASLLRPDGQGDTPPGSLTSAVPPTPPLPRGRYVARKGR
jgi:hypothetical protein